jgi:hypothetical protein
MAKKTKYFVIAPDGSKHTRNSFNLYTVACLVQKCDGTWKVEAFSSNLKNLQKSINYARKLRKFKCNFGENGEYINSIDLGPLYLNILTAPVEIEE